MTSKLIVYIYFGGTCKMKIFNMVGYGNYNWTVRITEEKNKNLISIHSQSMGRTIYENHEIWDSDVLKLIRTLDKDRYNHNVKLTDIIKKLNKNTSHLNITITDEHSFNLL